MGIEIPSEVTWLFPIVVGQSWPEGDETALRRMADAYRTAAQGVKSVIDEANGAASTVMASQTGEAVGRFEEYWKKFADGDESYLPKLQKICEQLAESCDNTALEVEYTKLSIIASLIALAIEIAALVAAAFGTFGATTAGIPIAQQATRLIVQFTFRQLILAILKEVAISVGIDAAIQGVQMLSGNRENWDWGKTGEAAVSGAVSGLVGGVSGGMKFEGGGLAGQVAVGATRGAVEGAVSTVGTAAVMGQDISARDVLMGASAGAVSGGIGGAKDGITVEAPRVNVGGPGGPPDLGPVSSPPSLGNPAGTPGGTPAGTPGGTPGGSTSGGPTISRDGLNTPRGGDSTTASSVAAPPAPGPSVAAPPRIGGGEAPTPGGTSAPAGFSGAPATAPIARPGAGSLPTSPGTGGSAPSISNRLGAPTTGTPLAGSTPGGTSPGSTPRAPGAAGIPGATPHGTPFATPGATPGTTPGGTAGRAPGGLPGGVGVPGGSAFTPTTTPGGPTPGTSGLGTAPTPGGSTPGGPVPGGSTPGGSTPGGPVPGGSVPGGSVPGGSVPGGSVPGAGPVPGVTGGPVPGVAPTSGVAPMAPPAGGPAGGPAVGGPGASGPAPAGPGAGSAAGMGAPMAGGAGLAAPPAGGGGGGGGGRGPSAPTSSGFFSDPNSGGHDQTVPGTDAVSASSTTGMPVQPFHETGPAPQHTTPVMPEQRGPSAPPAGGIAAQPGGFGPQPGGFGPTGHQPGAGAPPHHPGAGTQPTRPDASTPAPRPPQGSAPTTPRADLGTAPRTDAPASRGPEAPASRGTEAPASRGTEAPASRGTESPTPTPDATPSPTPDATTPDGTTPDGTTPDTVGAPGDEHSPASSHEWPADTAPADPASAGGATPAADPFPHKGVWGNPAGVVPGFSHDGPYHSVHDSTGPTDREIGTYDQRAAAIIEPTYQPYGPHGSYQPFIDAHSHPDGSIAWPANQGADGPRVVVELPAGTVLDRFGSPNGDFLSPLRPDGQPYGFGERAILPDSMGKGYHVYVLDAPLTVELAQVAPAFDQPGGARQLQPVVDPALIDPATGQMSVQRLLDLGVMREVDVPPADGRVLAPDFGTFDRGGNVLRPDAATVADARAGAFDGYPSAEGPATHTPNPDLGPVAHNGPIPLGEVSQRVDQAIRNSQVTDSGVALHTEDRLRDLSGRIPATDGHALLDVHTDGDGVRIGDTHYTRPELVELITNHPDLANRPITFVGCDAGAGGENSLAAHVARETGQPVTAPDTLAWSDQHGNLYASSPTETGGPRIPPDGGWHAFEPDGTSTPVGDNGMPPGHEPKGDLATATDDQAHRGRQDVEPQVQTPWQEPETRHRETVRLAEDQSLFDGRELPRDTRIEVRNPNGEVRTVVHVDADGRVHVDAIAPNTRHGDNPEVRHPAPDAHYRVETGHRHDAFVANADGTRQTTEGTVRIGGQEVPVQRTAIIETPPPPANGRVVIGQDHPLAPGPGEAFTARTDLPPDTRLEVHDTDGAYRGTVQTDADGRPRWIAAPDFLGESRNPEVTHPVGGANYNIDRGPLHQEFTTDANGHPQNAVDGTAPAFRDQHSVGDLGQGEPFSRPGQVHDANTQYTVTDEHGQHRGRFITDDAGHVVFEETHSGQRSRVNNEIAHAPAGANITSDGFYGLGRAEQPARTWPAPGSGEVQLQQVRTRVDGEYQYSVQVVGGVPAHWTPAQVAAVTAPFGNATPFSARPDLPPNTRFTLDDHQKQGYGTFQTGDDGAVSHLHTFRPFSPDLNLPLPNATLTADNGMWRGRTNGDGETVATTGRPDISSGGAIRRDGAAQIEVGNHGEVDGNGRKLSDGGHHQGNELGFPAEAANQSSQQRDQNQGNGRPAFASAETWHRMERDRSKFIKAGGTVEIIDTFALRDPLQRHPHTYQTRWRVTLADGTTEIYVRSYPNEHNAALWPAEF
ncbi:glycohydrolase toxin TNT-related protein [Actinosynnema sp. NPDC047251]|uniref:DUF4237 domain-containing protein n=1 Tax=Saccharothrix espanaensis (strain ATCC 51144 / DSM 44229 / JCM 9112 / NBRC 15066 / NRRL 15764) TaxID=1179773 RepID=K0K441_SACES|nr:TNT domain-containing protein [Saccharothrix espanaensis]CCH35025.1 hypothetical protein BN6_78060 [Saccharothrix espanaensis DSM 44229]